MTESTSETGVSVVLDIFDAAKWDVHFSERRRLDREKAAAIASLTIGYLRAMRDESSSAFLALKKMIEIAESGG